MLESSLKVCVLASGSRGNCTFVSAGETRILIDIGISCSEVVQKLAEIGEFAENINGVLITHEHSDHIKGLLAFCNKYNKKAFIHEKCLPYLSMKVGNLALKNIVVFDDGDFYLGALTISPFHVPHDSAYCVGFGIYYQGRKVSVLTDVGTVSSATLEKLINSDLTIIEANHNENMLRNGTYSYSLKSRILSTHGHLSNAECGRTIKSLILKGRSREFLLAHISQENNSYEVAKNDVENELLEITEKYSISVCTQKNVSKIFIIK